jgi:hypothetical protein
VRPLLAIADLARSDWPELAGDAAQELSGSDDEITLVGYFLKDVRTLMINSKVNRVLSRDIIRVMNPMHDRPWEDLRRGHEINEWWPGWQTLWENKKIRAKQRQMTPNSAN